MANQFEDSDAEYSVLVNDEGQYSLWSAFAAVPGGWTVRLQRATRQQCLDHIIEHWTDMQPLSLRRTMEDSASS